MQHVPAVHAEHFRTDQAIEIHNVFSIFSYQVVFLICVLLLEASLCKEFLEMAHHIPVIDAEDFTAESDSVSWYFKST